MLNDPAPRVRRDAVRSLGQIGPTAADFAADIEKLLNDPEQIVRDAALTTLKVIAPDRVGALKPGEPPSANPAAPTQKP
jgi:HEAT repeat protein